MRSSIYISDDLREAARTRGILLGYESMSQYLAGLIRMDVIEDRGHDQAIRINELIGRKRDAIDAKILETVQTAESRWAVVEDKDVIEFTAALDAKRPKGTKAAAR